jgi:arabinan endo-1,5-alpha-L-arabinosidase
MPTNLLVNRNNYQSGNPTVFNTKQVDFDGTDDYLDTNKSDFLGTSDFTISGWIKPEDITNNYLLGQSEDTNNRLYVRINATSKLQIYSKSGGVEQVATVSTTTIPNNEWLHFVITADRGANTIIYINGIVDNTDTNSNTSTLSNTGTFRIGSYQFANAYWNGQISQVGLWNSTLTADEVSSLYNHGLPIDLTTRSSSL